MRIILILVFGVFQPCRAGFDQTGSGSRAQALGGAFTAVPGDLWAVSFNAGCLSELGREEASFFFSPSPFGLRELSAEAVAVGFPSGFGVIALSAESFGDSFYREITATFSYARPVPHAGVGMSVHYHSAAIQNYGSAGTFALDAGIMVEALSSLRFGLSVKNVNAAVIGASREALPQIEAIGTSYAPAGNVVLAIDLRKETGVDASVGFGFEYSIVEAVALRAGISDAASAYTGGVGIRCGPVRIDYACASHPELGWTHDITLSVSWGGGHD